MEWNKKLQLIIEYVEERLQRKEENINPDEIAKLAGCSYAFFQKVFSYMTEISFAEYIRNRKLTLAGYDFKSSNCKVVDISYKYGYNSPTSFTKAFQQFHGISPTDAKKASSKLMVYPKMQIEVKKEFSWRLEKRKAFRLIGKCYQIPNGCVDLSSAILNIWSECQKDGTFVNLTNMDEADIQGLFALFDSDEDHNMIYYIMVISSLPLKEDYIELLIPNATWATFDCIGAIPQSIQHGWNYLQQEWLIKYPFQHDQCLEIEWYSNANTYAKDYVSQIWIPIIEEE